MATRLPGIWNEDLKPRTCRRGICRDGRKLAAALSFMRLDDEAHSKQIDSMEKHLSWTFENTSSSVAGHHSTSELSVIAVPAGTRPKRQNSMSSNNRRTSRQAVNSPAWLEIAGDTRLRRCELIDISANGARLIVEDAENTPDNFNLLLSRFGSPCYRCNVVWKQGDEMGVEFFASPGSGAGEAAGSDAALK
jgi:hypothetical protein